MPTTIITPCRCSGNNSSNLDKCFTCSLDFAIAESRFNISTYNDLIRETKLQVLVDVQQLSSRRDAVEVAEIGRGRIARFRARRNGEVERVWRRFAGAWEDAVREDNGRRLSVVFDEGSRDAEGMVVPKLLWMNDRRKVVVEETVNLG